MCELTMLSDSSSFTMSLFEKLSTSQAWRKRMFPYTPFVPIRH